jgi:adenosylhomocysteine nucleosidase
VSGILILTAVELEARVLARALDLGALGSVPFPAFGRGPVRLAPVGVGARLLAERGPRLLDGLGRPLVVSAGVCAGLDPLLRPGDVVLPGRVVGPAGELHAVTGARHRAVSPRAASTAPLVTTGEVLTTPGAKAALFARTGAGAADMESALILGWASAAGCPALVVRGVSDGADDALPRELLDLVTPDGALRLGRALGLGVTRPWIVRRALGVRRAARRALREVAAVLAALIG